MVSEWFLFSYHVPGSNVFLRSLQHKDVLSSSLLGSYAPELMRE